MRVRLAKRFRGAQSSTNSFAHLDALVFLTKWRHAALDSLEEVMDSKAVDGGFEFKVQRVGGTVESVRGHSEATRQLAKNIQEKHEALSQFF